MASSKDYNIGILDIKKPRDCSCQELLSASNVVLDGWLRKRGLINKLVEINWSRVYVVLGNQCLYYFSSETSKKASGSVSLYGFNRICRASRNKAKQTVWAFQLEHIQPSIGTLYFSASSEKDMLKWMKAIKEEMLEANGKRLRCSAPDSQYGGSIASGDSCDSDYSYLETCIYEEPVNRPLSLNSESFETFDSDFEDTKEALPTYSIAPTIPKSKVPPIEGTRYSLQKPLPDMNDSVHYWNSARFNGSKVEASSIISKLAQNGTYLIRKGDDNVDVLVVFIDIVRKFRVNKRENGKLSLSNKESAFDYIEDLLYHYYSNNLPNHNIKLVCPYMLHKDYHDYKGFKN